MQGRPFATAGTVAARLPKRFRHWQRVGSYAAARNPRQAGGSVMASSLLPLLVGGDLQNTKKNTTGKLF